MTSLRREAKKTRYGLQQAFAAELQLSEQTIIERIGGLKYGDTSGHSYYFTK